MRPGEKTFQKTPKPSSVFKDVFWFLVFFCVLSFSSCICFPCKHKSSLILIFPSSYSLLPLFCFKMTFSFDQRVIWPPPFKYLFFIPLFYLLFFLLFNLFYFEFFCPEYMVLFLFLFLFWPNKGGRGQKRDNEPFCEVYYCANETQPCGETYNEFGQYTTITRMV